MRIAIDIEADLCAWAERLKCTEMQLIEAVKTVGNLAEDVGRYVLQYRA